MSTQTLRYVVPGVLLFHGLGFIGALAALFVVASGHPGGGWLAARSWLLPSLAPLTARVIASTFWAVSMLGFVAASLWFWGVLPSTIWRGLAVTFAVISTVGIGLFFGTWPMFNTLAALGVNVAILYIQFWQHWPPPEIFGT